MKDFPLVSVGIPCYNRPEGLEKTLNCIAGQSYKNLDILISDNCSTNPDVELIAKKFLENDPRIRYIRQKENIGAEENFNYVLNNSYGHFFMWASDDDEWSHDHIRILMESFEDDIILVASNWENIAVNGTKVSKKFDGSIFDDEPKVTFCKYLSLHQWRTTPANMIYGIFRKDAIIDAWNNNYVDLYFAKDLTFIMETICIGKIKFLDEITWIKSCSEQYYFEDTFYLKYKLRKYYYSLQDIVFLRIIRQERYYKFYQYKQFIDELIDRYWDGSRDLKIKNALIFIRNTFL